MGFEVNCRKGSGVATATKLTALFLASVGRDGAGHADAVATRAGGGEFWA